MFSTVFNALFGIAIVAILAYGYVQMRRGSQQTKEE